MSRKSEPKQLTATQKRLLTKLLEERQQYMVRWDAELQQFLREVEQEIGLAAGSIGNMYNLTENGELQEVEIGAAPEA